MLTTDRPSPVTRGDAAPLQGIAADPILSASLYCGGGLDNLIAAVVAPFWRRSRAAGLERSSCIWFLRYSHRGEQLKVRIHAPEERCGALRRHLDDAARRYFAQPQSQDALAGRRPRATAIPIDPEDRGATPEPADRTLLWNRVERSLVVLGSPFFLRDDECVRRMTAAMGQGCEVLLLAFLGEEKRRTTAWRRGFLQGMAAAGLQAVFPATRQRRRYLAYHRDWLIRAPVLACGRGAAVGDERLAGFETAIAARGMAAIQAEVDAARATVAAWPHALAAWCVALAELRRYLEDAARLEVRDVDPFVAGPVFPALFKVLHGLGNAVGLNSLQEARAYHYLLRAGGAPASDRRFVLVPARGRTALPAAEPTAEAPRLFDFEAEYRWDDLVAAHGTEAARWLADYRRVTKEPWDLIHDALRCLRQRRLDAAGDLLTQAARRRADLDPTTSQFHVLGRFYFGVLAYAHFCRQELAAARGALDAALDAIRRALEVDLFLLPVAAMGTDMLIKRIHVERARCAWVAMRREAATVHAVTADRRPLLVLSGGRPVYHATIGEDIARLGRPPQDVERVVRYLMHAGQRLYLLQREVNSLYSLPGFVIPYP
jgi:hypothetical protein